MTDEKARKTRLLLVHLFRLAIISLLHNTYTMLHTAAPYCTYNCTLLNTSTIKIALCRKLLRFTCLTS